MKIAKYVTCLGAGLLIATNALAADAKKSLKENLTQLSQFTADFSQQVYDAEGTLIQDASGELALSRPNKFRWQILQPEEELIVSNGSNIWMYSPFVEQVSILTFDQAITDTPFMLLAGNDKKIWDKYQVTRKGKVYTIVNHNPDSQIATFSITFADSGQIASFKLAEKEGQSSLFTLTKQISDKALAKQQFEFVIPEGVEVDDQR